MAIKSKLSPRKLMEKALETMRLSVPESRADGKASPAVGAVILKRDGSVETACRGELRCGDHAEFTLLERKNRSVSLEGSVLFATLEPCAPGARTPPKMSCAERIVAARIKEVWVGIEDPDPTVDRKGIKFLQDNGVIVHMFERDLQDQIVTYNKAFIAQAEKRAAAQKDVQPVVLSPLEGGVSNSSLGFLSSDALERYRTVAGISDEVESDAFRRRLVGQGLLRVDPEGSFVPSGFGLLLFGEAPRETMPQAGLLGTILYADGREETRDFDGPLIDVPGQVEQWLKDKLPNTIDRGEMRRKQASDLPFELVREAVVNALVHRDYGIEGAKCQLIVTPDAIRVRSPGGPVEPITLEQLQSFDAPMLSRNPSLHYVFARMKLAEERGLGLHTFKSLTGKRGLPLPKYRWNAPYLDLELYRHLLSAEKGLPADKLRALNKAERLGWQWLSTREAVTSSEYAEYMKVPNRTALNHLKKFTKLRLLKQSGAGRATEYRIVFK